MAATQFTVEDLPDVVFTVERGSGGDSGLPSNWLTIVGVREETPDPTDDIPNPEPTSVEVCRIGFAGP